MVLTESEKLDTGFKAPDFTLPEPLSGGTVTLSEYSQGAAATVIMIICNHCPFVVLLKKGIAQLARDYETRGVKFVAISSNSVVTHPQDGPEKMKEDAQRYGFPYLYDETQEVAKAYKAACTPEFLVFDSELGLQYHGQFDDARPSREVAVTGRNLRAALDAVLAGHAVPKPWPPSIGCNVKWAPGNEPEWFG